MLCYDQESAWNKIIIINNNINEKGIKSFSETHHGIIERWFLLMVSAVSIKHLKNKQANEQTKLIFCSTHNLSAEKTEGQYVKVEQKL